MNETSSSLPVRIAETVAAKLDRDKIAAYQLPEESRNLILAYADRVIGDPACDWATVQYETGYSSSVMSRLFKGEYAGNVANVATAIRRFFQRKAEASARAAYVPNQITNLVHRTIRYACANSTIALVVGPSRIGKTAAVQAYVDADVSRQAAALVTCPPVGGTNELLRRICSAFGLRATASHATGYSLAALAKFLSPSRLLILDEAQRLVPSERRTSPRLLELIRDLHDTTHVPIVLVATTRLEDQLAASTYVHEQLIGRILAPLRISGDLRPEDWQPIARSLLPDLGPVALEALAGPAVVQSPQRLAALIHVCSLARAAADKAGRAPTDDDVLSAIKWRRRNFAASVLANPVRRGRKAV